MPFSRPTLRDLVRRVVSDVETRLDSPVARLRHTTENVLARAIAGLSHSLHGHLQWIAENVVWDTAGPLTRRWASIFGIDMLPAVRATGQVTVSGTIGTLIPAGTTWSRADGVLYELLADYTTDSDPDNVNGCRCKTAGAIGNADAGTPLTITSPLAGLNAAAVVGGDKFEGGVDQETDVALLDRWLFRLRKPPSGGGPGDYVRWAKSWRSDVTRVWEKPRTPKVGQVTFYSVSDTPGGTLPFGDTDLQLMLAHVETLAPLHMQGKLFSLSPNPTALTVQVDNIDPDNDAIREAIAENIHLTVLARSEPGEFTFKVGWIHAAIGRAPGIKSWDLTTPAGDVVVPVEELLTFDADTDLTIT